jgi:hypothetical protein
MLSIIRITLVNFTKCMHAQHLLRTSLTPFFSMRIAIIVEHAHCRHGGTHEIMPRAEGESP